MNNKKKQGLALIFACLFMAPWSLWANPWANPHSFKLLFQPENTLVLQWQNVLWGKTYNFKVYAMFGGNAAKGFSKPNEVTYTINNNATFGDLLATTNTLKVTGAKRGALYTAVVHVHQNDVSQDRMMSSWGANIYAHPHLDVPYNPPQNIQVNTKTPRKVIIDWSNDAANFPAHYVVTISGEGVNAEQKTTGTSLTYSGDFKGNQTYTVSIKAVDPDGRAALNSSAATHEFTYPDYDPQFTFQDQPFIHRNKNNDSCSHSCTVTGNQFCILDTPEADQACTDLNALLLGKTTSITSLSYESLGGGINMTVQFPFSSFIPQKSSVQHACSYNFHDKEANKTTSKQETFDSIQSTASTRAELPYGSSYEAYASCAINFPEEGFFFKSTSETKSITVPLLPPSHVDVTYKDKKILIQASDHEKNHKDSVYYHFIIEGPEGPGVKTNVNSNDSGFSFFKKDFQEGGVYSVTAFSKRKNSSLYDSKSARKASITIPYQPPQAPQDLQLIVQDAQVLVYWQHPEEGKTFNYVWRLTDNASSEEIRNGTTSEKSLLFNLDAFKKDAAYTLSLHSEKNNLKSEVITGSFSTPPEPAEVPPSGDNNDGDSSTNMTRVDPNNSGSSGFTSSPSGGTNASVTSTPSSGSSQTSPNGSSSNTSPNGSSSNSSPNGSSSNSSPNGSSSNSSPNTTNMQTPLPQGNVAMPIPGCSFGKL